MAFDFAAVPPAVEKSQPATIARGG